MIEISALPDFQRELKKLAKKYPTLPSDIQDIEVVLRELPAGIGKNFTIIRVKGDITIVKARVHCESLHSRAIRLIYAYHAGTIQFMYLELYFKGDTENEDRSRINAYLSQF